MTPEEREAIYDAEIAPELSRLAQRCQDSANVDVRPPARSAGFHSTAATNDMPLAEPGYVQGPKWPVEDE